MSESKEIQTDVLVVGSGAAGLTAAATAASRGLDVILVEKASTFGGTTAYSGGVLWIPNNHMMAQEGVEDSEEAALTYLTGHIGNRVEPARLKRFVQHAPEMLREFVESGYLKVSLFSDFPDYSAETPGGVMGGRSVEPQVFSGSKLGEFQDTLRKRQVPTAPGGLIGNMMELRQLAVIRTDPLTALKAWRVFPRWLRSRLTGERYYGQGGALVSWLRAALGKLQVPVWLETSLESLQLSAGRVSGAVINRQGETLQVNTRCGVIMASGGFDHDALMREQYQGDDRGTEYTSGAETNTGDGIRAGQDSGAAIDLMEDAWWAPTFLMPDGSPQIVIFERGKPGFLIVDQSGRRFANEALPYNEFVKRMHEAEATGMRTHPSWFVFDDTYRRRYPVAGLLPGQSCDHYVANGFMLRAGSLAALAGQMEADTNVLEETIARFNQMAKQGKDEDFDRGNTPFDRYTGDPTVSPNPCLAPVDAAPFYAIRLYPGDLGTKGGLSTNEYAQVLRDDGTVIDGLYAAGNTSASVMGHFYPGAGGTIGPAMTFGYIAARHATGNL
ncbi:MAG: FAD-dependent oxidoreductase [Proteobacteria bacterium]|nr:FAD-dependent oxidoreductase [Pseudomonadota bacterium]